jgi:hypothetical protein
MTTNFIYRKPECVVYNMNQMIVLSLLKRLHNLRNRIVRKFSYHA